MREIILISFLGPDQPNQFTRLMQVLSVHSLQILYVGQAVIHNQLTALLILSEDVCCVNNLVDQSCLSVVNVCDNRYISNVLHIHFLRVQM